MIPLIDLKAQYQSIKPEIDTAIGRVLETGAFALGPAVADFEVRFARYCRTGTAVGVNSGTSALHLALLSLGIGPGDDVIAPAMTFVATIAAIGYTGARPVLVDVEPGTLTIDPEKIESAITPHTKAVLPVHLFGQCADMDPILEMAARRKILVIEDAAQAHGAEYKGRRAGSMGVVGCFSFYPGKNLGAYGEGGAVVTSRWDLDKTIRMMRDWGTDRKYYHDVKGFNYRMEGIQGAVLGVKMAHIEEWTEKRRAAARWYRRLFRNVDGIRLPEESTDRRHVYHIFAVFVKNRDGVAKNMQEAGIGVGIHYPIPVHLQNCFADLGYAQGDFPIAETIGNEELSLPLYPEITRDQQDAVADALIRAVREKP